jgi:hypothetical protein
MKCNKCGVPMSNGFRGCTPCRKVKRDFWISLAGIVFLVAAIVGGRALHADWAYGDWTCGFKNCRVAK